MLALALILLSQVTPDSRVSRVERVPGGRMEGGRGGVKGWAFFEAFPVGGAGTTTACSTTPPTGAKGEALTFARTGNATCTSTATGGLATSGIANGDLVEMSANQPRVEYDSGGVKGLRVEAARVNSLFRFIEFGNALWADVGTPTLTGSQASPFTGTYATSAVQFDDNDAVAFEGRSQVVTVTATAAYYAHCYVKAGTATSARISLDGTAATITGLSSSTWSIVEVADASASAGTVTFEVDVGSTTAATGTVTFGGCQVEAGTYRTSIIPTTSAAVTRNAETATVDIGASAPYANNMSMAITSQLEGNASGVSGTMNANAVSFAATTGDDSLWLYFSSGGSQRCYSSGTFTGTVATSLSGPQRAWCSVTTAAVTGNYGGTAMTASGALSDPTYASPARYVNIGASPFPYSYDGIYSRVCVDPSPTRCR